MPTNNLKRPDFFPGQYLSADDLSSAQDYQRTQDQRHRLAAHTWGIAAGLDLIEQTRPVSDGTVEVHLAPGYAVDGFGRAVLVLEPFRIPEELLKQFVVDPAKFPTGQWIPLWLRYWETKESPPRPDLTGCKDEEQWQRIRESFRVIPGFLPVPAQQRDNVVVAGKSIAAEAIFADASVPHQALPEAGNEARWLIPIGQVRWNGKNFVESKSDDDKRAASLGRCCMGIVTECVLAPAGRVRVRSRALSPAPDTKHLAAIEGSLRVDGEAQFSGNVAVGVPDPKYRLEVEASFDGDGIRLIGSANPLSDAGITFSDKAGLQQDAFLGFASAPHAWMTNAHPGDLVLGVRQGDLCLGSGGPTKTPTMFVSETGVGIGDRPPADSKLHVAGDVHVTGQITSFSDIRFKKNIQPLTSILAKLDKIRAVTFEGTALQKTLGGTVDRREIGVVAQEIEKVFPELVVKRGPEEYRAVDYGRLTVVLLEAVKELKGQVDHLHDRISQLQRPGSKREPPKKSRRPLRKAP